MARKGDAPSLQELKTGNHLRMELITKRTIQLSIANDKLHRKNIELASEIAERKLAQKGRGNIKTCEGITVVYPVDT